MHQESLPTGWGLPEKPFHSTHVLRLRGRMSWFARLAAKGLVAAPDDAHGVDSPVTACLPELGENPHQVTQYRKRERCGLLEPNGFIHHADMKVSLYDLRYPMPLLVSAPTPGAAARLLKSVLAESLEVWESQEKVVPRWSPNPFRQPDRGNKKPSRL